MKKVFRFLGFVLLLTGVLVTTYSVFKLKDTTGEPESAILQLADIDNDLIDVFFVGSSHVYCGINPGAIYRTNGIAAYDLSVSGMDLESAYYFTKYETGIHNPKVVVVDVYGLTFDGYSEEPALIGNKYRNLIQMPYSPEAYKLVKSTADDDEVMDYLLRWPIIHSRYRELTDADFTPTDKSAYNLGELVLTKITDYIDLSLADSMTAVEPLSDYHKEWVERFAELSKERGFELVFMRIPFQPTEQNEAIFKGFEEYVQEKGYAYADLMAVKNELNYGLADFSDQGHLNMYGAKKISGWLAEYLKDNYELEDHRNDDRYAAWSKNAQYLYMTNTILDIKNVAEAGTPFNFINEIQGYDSIENIVIYRGQADDCYSPVEEYLDYLGIDFSEYIYGGVWIVRGNKVTQLLSGDDKRVIYYDLDERHTIKIDNTSDDTDFIKLNENTLGCLETGITIISYDLFNQEIIVNKQYN